MHKEIKNSLLRVEAKAEEEDSWAEVRLAEAPRPSC